jgi:hypothetical protein
LTGHPLAVRFPYHDERLSYIMNRNDVEKIVTDVLVAVVQAIGAPMPALTPDLRPIGALPNFDSVLAEDTTVEIFGALGLDEDHDINPFVKPNRAATLGEVVDTLYALVARAA